MQIKHKPPNLAPIGAESPQAWSEKRDRSYYEKSSLALLLYSPKLKAKASVRDAQGNVMANYTRTFVTDAQADHYRTLVKQKEIPLYGSSRLGVKNVDELAHYSRFKASIDGTSKRFEEFEAEPTTGWSLPGGGDGTMGIYSEDTSKFFTHPSSGSVTVRLYSESAIDVFSEDVISIADTASGEMISSTHYRIPALSDATLTSSSGAKLNVFSNSVISFKNDTDVDVECTCASIRGKTTLPPWVDVKHFDRTMGEKRYELTNHLGNVYATVSDQKLGVDDGVYNSSGTQTSGTADDILDYYTADVKSYADYYPFGSLEPNRHGGETGYRYGFNGKEHDPEVKGDNVQYDYGFRIYDARVGRFLSLDPLFKSYPWYTPYQFAGNTPIQAIDLDGLEEYHFLLTLDDQGEAVITPTHEVDIVDVVFNTNTMSLETQVNQRQEYIVHLQTEMHVTVGMLAYKTTTDFTEEYSSRSEVMNATMQDFETDFQIVGIIESAGAGLASRGRVRAASIHSPKVSGKPTHGNSLSSNKVQHGYEITNVTRGERHKVGVSGGKLNADGSSRRANSQVNKLNKGGTDIFKAEVKIKDVKGRQSIIQWEKNEVNKLYDDLGEIARGQKRPQPTSKPKGN